MAGMKLLRAQTFTAISKADLKSILHEKKPMLSMMFAGRSSVRLWQQALVRRLHHLLPPYSDGRPLHCGRHNIFHPCLGDDHYHCYYHYHYHCYYHYHYHSEQVGEHDTTDSEADIRTISAITDHPDYDRNNNFAYDFSILTLAEPLTFSSVVAPVCLPSLVSSLYTGRAVHGTKFHSC